MLSQCHDKKMYIKDNISDVILIWFITFPIFLSLIGQNKYKYLYSDIIHEQFRIDLSEYYDSYRNRK